MPSAKGEDYLGALAAGELSHAPVERDVKRSKAATHQRRVPAAVQPPTEFEHVSYREVAIERGLLREESDAIEKDEEVSLRRSSEDADFANTWVR